MDFFILKQNSLLWCSQTSTLNKTNITWNILLFDGLAWKHASQLENMLYSLSSQQLSDAYTMYFLFCDSAWKHPVCCDQVTQCSGSLTLSLVLVTSMSDATTIRGKRIMNHTQLRNMCKVPHMDLFLPETDRIWRQMTSSRI